MATETIPTPTETPSTDFSPVYDVKGNISGYNTPNGFKSSAPTTQPQAPITPQTSPGVSTQAAPVGALKSANGNWVDAQGNQYSLAPGTKPDTSSVVSPTNKPTDLINTSNANIAALDKQRQDAYNTFASTVEGLTSGTTPLTAGEQAQVDAIKAAYQGMIAQQRTINTGAEGTANVRGYQKGAAQYDPTFQAKTIGSIVSAGVQKVGELEVKMAGAVAQLTQALRDRDITNVRTAYQDYEKFSKDRRDQFDETIKNAQVAIKEANDKTKQDEKDYYEQVQKPINDLANTAAKNGAPNEVIDAIRNSKSPIDATQAAGKYMMSESDMLDAQYKKAQISKIYHDIQNEGVGGIDAPQLIAYANEYAASGKIPTGLPKGTFGAVAQVAKELPKSPGQIIGINTGVTPTGDTTLQQGVGNLYSAVELSKQLKDLDRERWDGLVAGSFGKVFGSDTQTKYTDLRAQIVDLLSRARSGAALTTSEEKRYSDMLPGRFSESFWLGADSQVKIDNFISTLTSDMKNKASAQGWAINGVSDAKVGDTTYKVGDVITNAGGQQGRVNADGSITIL